MADILNLKRLKMKLRALVSRFGPLETSVIVGYTAEYSIFVHENLEASHKTGKQAKFLETPARQNQDVYAAIVAKALKQGEKSDGALLLAGLKLQTDSQRLVPVDTGNLRGSAFTRVEHSK